MNGNTGLQELVAAIDAQGSRRDFARKVDMGEPYLSMILSGKRSLSRLPVQTAVKISKEAGIPLERLTASTEAAKRSGKKVVG